MAADAKYDMSVYPTAGLVRSASDGAKSYQVTLPSCHCGDFLNCKGKIVETPDGPAIAVCKHIAEFLARVGGWHKPAPEPTVFGPLTSIAAKALLGGEDVGLSPDHAARVLRNARTLEGKFLSQGYALPDGVVTYDRARDLYTVTLTY